MRKELSVVVIAGGMKEHRCTWLLEEKGESVSPLQSDLYVSAIAKIT